METDSTLGPPVQIDDLPGGYRFTWPVANVVALVNRITEDRRGKSTSAEVKIASTSPAAKGHLYQGRLNLTSPTSKRTLRQELETMDATMEWLPVVEYLATETLRRWRTGEPVVRVGKLDKRTRPRYRLYPLLPEGQPTILYGKWGSFKSYLALALCLMVQTGKEFMGFEPIRGNVLYLDYESEKEDIDERIKALCSGWGIEPVEILYRFCVSPLEDDLERIQEIVAEADIHLLVVDSVGLAVGGSLTEAEPALAMMRCLRSLRTTTLLLDHLSKVAMAGDSQNTMPYGSTYKTNLARSIREIICKQDPGASELEIGIYHRKASRSALNLPIGLLAEFVGEEGQENLFIRRKDVRDMPKLASTMSDKDQILSFLRDGAKTSKELEEELGKDSASIRARTSELKKGGAIVKLEDGRWGLVAKSEIPF